MNSEIGIKSEIEYFLGELIFAVCEIRLNAITLMCIPTRNSLPDTREKNPCSEISGNYPASP